MYHSREDAQDLFYEAECEKWDKAHGEEAERTTDEEDEMWNSWDAAPNNVRNKYEKEAAALEEKYEHGQRRKHAPDVSGKPELVGSQPYCNFTDCGFYASTLTDEHRSSTTVPVWERYATRSAATKAEVATMMGMATDQLNENLRLYWSGKGDEMSKGDVAKMVIEKFKAQKGDGGGLDTNSSTSTNTALLSSQPTTASGDDATEKVNISADVEAFFAESP